MAAAVAIASSFSLPGWGGNIGILLDDEVLRLVLLFIAVKRRVLPFELLFVRCCLITASAFLFSLAGTDVELAETLYSCIE